MTANLVRTGSLLGATLTMGLMAGTFGLYAHTVMPGLKRTDDQTFVSAFQSLDRAIVNPIFIGGMFLGALVLTAAATLTNRGEPAARWIAAALAAYVVAMVVTGVVHVPANDAIKAAGDTARLGDAATVRAQFNEARWAAWNLVRVVTSSLAFVSLAWALVLHGRSTV